MITLSQFGNPPQNLIPNANLTLAILDEIFNAFPGQFKFNSGYRTPAHNADVGGAANSFHPLALAADIGAINGNYAELKPGVVSILNKYGWELIDESKTKNHFHIEPAGGGNGQADLSAANSENALWWAVGVGLLILFL